ncbi:MAG: hypothetical protein U0R50_08305 [Gaiellales bacterium]
MLTWILAFALSVAILVAAVLTASLRRGRSRMDDVAAQIAGARAEVREAVETETAAHVAEIRRVHARERAASASQLAEEERRIAEGRRAEFLDRERRAGEELSDLLARSERRLEERLRGFSDDLDRAQRHLEAQLARLDQRQTHALQEVETRIETEAAELGSTADEQRKAVYRLREELERAASAAVAEALDELQAHTDERRRAIDEINERLRARETAIAESLERAETDVRARLDVLLVEWERRQTANLERVMEREVDRYSQLALMALDERIREAREDSLTRLARELDRAVELLSREELARRLDEPR